MAAVARLTASTCVSTIWRNRSSGSGWNSRAPPIPRSGPSSCRSRAPPWTNSDSFPRAPGHVGGEPGTGLLAVVADVDPDLELPLDGRLDGRLDLPLEQGGVHGLAALLADQEVTQDGVAGQAAHVGHEDALVTRDRLDPHRHCLPAPSLRSARRRRHAAGAIRDNRTRARA